jgi:hypothetical protein
MAEDGWGIVVMELASGIGVGDAQARIDNVAIIS